MTVAMRVDLAEGIDAIAQRSFDGVRSRAVIDAIGVYLLLHNAWGDDFDRKVADLRAVAKT